MHGLSYLNINDAFFNGYLYNFSWGFYLLIFFLIFILVFQGMKNIETISLELSRSKEIWFTSKIFAQMKRVFAKMKKLRLLKVYYSDHHSLMRKKYKISLPEGFEFPPELRYLHWEGLESLPSNFEGENLVAINLKSSNIKKLWKGKKVKPLLSLLFFIRFKEFFY